MLPDADGQVHRVEYSPFCSKLMDVTILAPYRGSTSLMGQDSTLERRRRGYEQQRGYCKCQGRKNLTDGEQRRKDAGVPRWLKRHDPVDRGKRDGESKHNESWSADRAAAIG